MSIQYFTSRNGILQGLAVVSLMAVVFGVLRIPSGNIPAGHNKVQIGKQVKQLPVPAIDITPVKTPSQQTIVLAGGCFWGVEAVFEKLQGVSNVVSGYAGGNADTANYNAVSGGSTGHAEAVQITYDPQQISLGKLLQVFFAVVHDPTQLNRQGPDRGSQYRSAIFFANADQQQVAQSYLSQLNKTQIFLQPLATKLESLQKFYPAENYHQDFISHNPSYPYVVVHDLPKIAQLQQQFPELVQK